MLTINKDVTITFDIDQTLIVWGSAAREYDQINYYGENVYVRPHLEHVRLLRSNLARGRNVIVWSGNGWEWAKTVLEYLVNSGHISTTEGIIVMSKPIGYVDDVECQHWMGNRIFLDK